MIRNNNFAEGTLFINYFNRLNTINIDKETFEWLKLQSIKFCKDFFKKPTFYGLIEFFENKTHANNVKCFC